MKKFGLKLISIFLILAIGAIYIVIPGNLIVSKIVYVNIKSTTASRYLQAEEKWTQWIPGKKAFNNNLIYHNNFYKLEKKSDVSFAISILSNEVLYQSEIDVIPYNINTCAIRWQFSFITSKNPIKRIKQYINSKSIHDDMSVLLNNFKEKSTNTQNVYDFNIEYTTLTDTALVSTKKSLQQWPSNQLIYNMIFQLQKYIKLHNASQHNYPMLNVTQTSNTDYEVMLGVPSNIPLTGNDSIKPKRMIMLRNKTLAVKVVGGLNKINQAIIAVDNFMEDNELSSPVIPFQQLITNRIEETDSTKWVTKIFIPII